ncbi:MAG: UDP-N-acetylglucosamine 4,6-dehydratase (inverting) [Candidatus Micrarchaeota archaeon]|nr:UDP-N-acetylglucosamine 4,6-dehydratase (inverting) [Candidatus Micrarchaeota archaeon]
MKDIFEGKTVLVTGGTGSFGQKFTETLLSKHNPYAIRIYSRGELKQVEMERKWGTEKTRFLIGDVRDKERLYRAMNGVDIVVHAAALKHVPVAEYNPAEAVKTNILGGMNIVDAAIDNGVERVLALSTDKAVHPVNLYGATKAVMEKIIIQGNVYRGKEKKTLFSCVRYGNVVGSSGSVIPLFLKQREKGEITLTDERMTRFWITLEQGANLVINSLSTMKGGEIFIPKIPSMKVTDLADVVAPGVKRNVTGIRPGEKLHEVLLTGDEARHSKEYDSHFVIEPEYKFWDAINNTGGKALPEGFSYSSDNNKVWLKGTELKKMLVEQGYKL